MVLEDKSNVGIWSLGLPSKSCDNPRCNKSTGESRKCLHNYLSKRIYGSNSPSSFVHQFPKEAPIEFISLCKLRHYRPQIFRGGPSDSFRARRKSNERSKSLARTVEWTNWEDAFQIFVVGISDGPNSTSPAPSTPPLTPLPTSSSSTPFPSSSPFVTAPVRPPGATGLCKDGTYSYSAHHQGMCRGHDGVAQFYS